MQRRNFLGGVAAGLGLLAVPRDSRAEAAQQRFLLIVFAQGAWDVTYALDPKQAPGCDVPAAKGAASAAEGPGGSMPSQS